MEIRWNFQVNSISGCQQNLFYCISSYYLCIGDACRYTQIDPVCIEQNFLLSVEKGPHSKAETQEEKWCNWRALIEELVMEVHSTRVQWPAPLQGPHLLICGSPLPGKYAPTCDNVSATLHLARGWVSAVVELFSSHINYPISRDEKKSLRHTHRPIQDINNTFLFNILNMHSIKFVQRKRRWATKGAVQARSHTCQRLVQAPSEDPDEKLS